MPGGVGGQRREPLPTRLVGVITGDSQQSRTYRIELPGIDFV